MNLTPKCNCEYGAPMGRREWNDNPTMAYCPSCETNVRTVGADEVRDQSLQLCAECGSYVEDPRPYAGRMYLRHIPLNSGGYDSGGAYWGTGERLYGYAAADGSINGYLHASNRGSAKVQVRLLYPGARFFDDREATDEIHGVRQTSCQHCGQDIENFAPYRKGEWRDRGNNTHCPDDSGRIHVPYKN